jgi:hypothetical protein
MNHNFKIKFQGIGGGCVLPLSYPRQYAYGHRDYGKGSQGSTFISCRNTQSSVHTDLYCNSALGSAVKVEYDEYLHS